MPLKKPKDIPKLPKTRKKNIEAAKKAIPFPKEDKIEYQCLAFFKFDATLNKEFCCFRIQTVAEFTSFAYEVSLAAQVERNEIDIIILGLQAKINYLPHVSAAITDVDLERLNGEYTVNVIKQDGSMNTAVFDFNYFKREIKLKNSFVPEKQNNRSFCEFLVSEKDFSFRE